jgi:hypothetical protein
MQYVHRYVNYGGLIYFQYMFLVVCFFFFFQKSYFAYRRIGLFSKTEFSRGVCHMCGPQVPLHCVPDMWARAHTTLQRKWAHTKDAPDPVPSQSPHRRPPLASPFPAGVKARQTP